MSQEAEIIEYLEEPMMGSAPGATDFTPDDIDASDNSHFCMGDTLDIFD